MLPKPVLLVAGSAIAIALGGTRLGPIVALLLVAVLASTALSSKTFSTNASNSLKYTGNVALLG